jgi:dihydropteroate synthase type 2
MAVKLLGVLNVTPDSFSDGGRYFEPETALQRGLELAAEGAHRIDVGAQSTHPDAPAVGAGEELRRLEPVLAGLVERGVSVSIDTYEPRVMARALELGVQCINDVRALREPGALDAVAGSRCEVILMHSTSSAGRAERAATASPDWMRHIAEFFGERLEACARAGIARERLILDPGMGLFLSSDASASFEVLRRLDELRAFGLPLCVGVSRKSFLGGALAQRGPATLAAELWCAARCVDWIRTHDVRALCDALRTTARLEGR